MLLMLCLAPFGAGPNAQEASFRLPEGFSVTAHRGVVTEGVLENSLPSLELTIARGYTHVEVDVRMSKDGVLVCHHDPTLERSLGIAAPVAKLTLSELRAYGSEAQVPTLDAFCEKAAGRIGLMVDVKEAPAEKRAVMIEGIRDALTKHGLLEGAFFIGSPAVGQAFAGEALVSWRGSAARAREFVANMENPGTKYFIFNHGADFTADTVKEYQALGLKVIVSINTQHYTQGDPIAQGRAHIRDMIAFGVDGLQIDSVYDDLIFGGGGVPR